MVLAKCLSLDETKQCDYAYLVYDKDDPEAHCFLRMDTTDSYISFDRPLPRKEAGRIFGDVHSQPHLIIDQYGKEWFAFDQRPDTMQIRNVKKKMTPWGRGR